MSKKEKVKKHLMDGKSITPLDALQQYGSFRLGAIIHELRKEGHDIKTSITKKGYARYYMGEPVRRVF